MAKNATIVFMDMVSFSKLPPVEQKALVGELTTTVRDLLRPLLSSEGELRLVALPTGDGMALGFLNCDDTGKSEVEWLLELIDKAKGWAKSRQVHLRIGLNSGDVEVTRDINGNPNLCGHAINDAQRVMDSANDDGVLWSKSALEYHFGKREPSAPSPFSFGDPVSVTVKHGDEIEVRQLFKMDEADTHWDRSALKSQWKNSFQLSSYAWSDVDHLSPRWGTSRNIALIHINGGVFRDYRWTSAHGRDSARPEGIDEELACAGEPFGPDLECLWIFIPTEKSYDYWVKENKKGVYESYDQCVSFWKPYLSKCARQRAKQLCDRSEECAPLTVELREYSTLGCLLYYFDWNSPGGMIRGCPYLWGVELKDSTNFEIHWRGKRKPPAFSEYVRGLNYIYAHSNELYCAKVNALGDVTETGLEPDA
ncbi:hypothetical protein [Tautonia marina]|uniref:hypothetical protein n=1 Tax=Tautonia marina TaxID=2653855 RepID=UPI001261190E|nr:hypothetical protein [Tautonia marina]